MADDQRQKTRVSPSGIRTAIKIARWAFSQGKMVFASVFGIMISTFIFVTVFAATEGGVIAPVDIPPGEEQPPPPPGEEPPPPPPPPLCGIVCEKIKNFFWVSVFVEKTNNRYDNCSDLQEIYEAYQKASQSDRYRSLLNGTSTTMRIYTDEGCSAYTHSPFIDIYIKGCRDITITYLTLHETGHRLSRFMQPEFSRNKLDELIEKDPTCYDQGYLKSYFRRKGSKHGESFAEMAALYVMGGRERVAGEGRPISDFKSEGDDSYNYIGGALYGGYEFR